GGRGDGCTPGRTTAAGGDAERVGRGSEVTTAGSGRLWSWSRCQASANRPSITTSSPTTSQVRGRVSSQAGERRPGRQGGGRSTSGSMAARLGGPRRPENAGC